MDTLGMKLKIARTRAKISQVETVRRLKTLGVDITQSYLSKLENDINEPNIKQLKSLARIYGIDIMTLIFSDTELETLKYKPYIDK